MSDALAAYWNFFTSFNIRKSREFSAALNYPHVRISPRRRPAVVPSLDAHAEGMTWQPFIDTGWDHTVGREPTLLHSGDNCAHVIGGWTRFTTDEKPILTNHVCYIVTKGVDGWGIQSRFGVDGDAGDANFATAVRVVEQYVDAVIAGNWQAAAVLANYPVLRIGVGHVSEATAPDEYADSLALGAPAEITGREVRAVQGGANGVNVAVEFEVTGGGRGQALLCVTNQDGHWGIQGRSIIDP